MGSPSRNVQYHPPRLSEDRLNLPQPHSPSLPTHCSGKSGMRPSEPAGPRGAGPGPGRPAGRARRRRPDPRCPGGGRPTRSPSERGRLDAVIRRATRAVARNRVLFHDRQNRRDADRDKRLLPPQVAWPARRRRRRTRQTLRGYPFLRNSSSGERQTIAGGAPAAIQAFSTTLRAAASRSSDSSTGPKYPVNVPFTGPSTIKHWSPPQ